MGSKRTEYYSCRGTLQLHYENSQLALHSNFVAHLKLPILTSDHFLKSVNVHFPYCNYIVELWDLPGSSLIWFWWVHWMILPCPCNWSLEEQFAKSIVIRDQNLSLKHIKQIILILWFQNHHIIGQFFY